MRALRWLGRRGLGEARIRRARLAIVFVGITIAALPTAGEATTQLTWMGHQWSVTEGRMAGVARGRASNVEVDSNGYLHLMITKTGKRATAGEIFSNDKMGFGTYQWEIQGPVDNMDPHAVLGLFPYGPQAGSGRDGENEIDIEFSRWANTLCGGACNADFTVYPSTGNLAVGPTEDDYNFNLAGGELVTARMSWSSTSVTETVMAGLHPPGTTENVLQTWTLAPPDYTVRIPQEAAPIGMNLWCFKRKVTTSQAVVIRSFQYLPASSNIL